MATQLSQTEGLTLLGQSGVPSQRKLEVFPRPVLGDDYRPMFIKFSTEEFTSFCPMTHQPDFGSIIIEYSPKDVCLESKSLKLYLQSFRDSGEFWEALSTIILNDVVTILQPHWAKVTCIQRPRGGIGLEVSSEYENF